MNLLVRSLLIALITTSSLEAEERTILYRENFDGEPQSPLAGHVPEISVSGAAWESVLVRDQRQSIRQDGGFYAWHQNSIWLPFTPQQGKKYILEAMLEITEGPTDRAVTLGFSAENKNRPFRGMETYGTIAMFRNRDATFAAFAGPGAEGEIKVPNLPFKPTMVRIELDATKTNPADWMLTFFIDEQNVEENVKVQNNSLANIAYVGITFVNGGSTGRVSNFSLTEISPD